MKRIGLGTLGVLAVALVGLTTTDALRAADDAASIIESRQTLMKGQSTHMKAINAILENGGDVSGIVKHAEALATSAQKIPTLFPEGTGMDDGVGRTGAKAAIWQDWSRFEAAAHRPQAGELEARGGRRDRRRDGRRRAVRGARQAGLRRLPHPVPAEAGLADAAYRIPK